MDENLELNNSSDQFIKVVVRVRPPDFSIDRISSICTRVNDQKEVILASKSSEEKQFTFDHVADCDSTQESIFRSVGKRIIEGCVEGYNGTIFAYGQTGSGKTYTMLGLSEESYNMESDARGLIHRCLDYLFSLIVRKKNLHGDNIEFLCKCSYVELYQEVAYDLLDSASSVLQVRENIQRGTFVEGVTEIVVNTAREAFEVLQKGWFNRTVAATAMNRESSRSHAVFMLFLESKEKTNGVVNLRISQLNLIDLAGSERQKDANTCDLRLKEAGSINKSLSVLGNVMMALVNISQGKNRHVPYRDSKLTFLLRDSLGGNARTCIIANIHPNSKCFGETLSTLQFARRAKQVKNRAIVNEDVIASDLAALQVEIKRLKELLKRNSQSPLVLNNDSSNVPGKPESDLVDAFRLVKKYDDDKEKLKKYVNAYKEAFERCEKNLLATKLIIKLRESKIETLENFIKDSSNGDVLSQKLGENLQNEIEQLKRQLEHHPQVVALKLQVDKLHEDNRILRRAPDILNVEKLEENVRNKLRSLLENAAKNNETIDSDLFSFPSCMTPAPTKVQMDMKKDLNAMNIDNERLNDENERLKRELESAKRTIDELEKILRASRLQKEILNDLHVSTLKSLTPPHRAPTTMRKTARRQTIFFTPATGMGAAENESRMFTAENGICPTTPRVALFKPDMLNRVDLMDEEEPLELLRTEDLVVEIKKLREMNVELEKKVDRQQRDILRLETDHNCLQQVANDSNKRVDDLKKEYNVRESELCSQMAEISHNLRVKTEESEFAASEAQDLKIILNSCEKQLEEAKKRCAARDNEISGDFSSLQTKVSQLQVLIDLLNKERDSLLEDKENLSNRVEILEAQCLFNSDLMLDLEEKYLAEEKMRIALEISLASTKTTKEQLQSQKDIEISVLSDEIRELRNDNCLLLDGKRSLEDEINQLKQAVSSEMVDLQAMKARLNERTTECERLSSELNEAKTQLDSLSATYEEIGNDFKVIQSQFINEKQKSDDLLKKFDLKETKFDNKCASYESEIIRLLSKVDEFEQQVNNSNLRIQMLTIENRELTRLVNEKSVQSSQNSAELEQLLNDKDDELNKLREKMREVCESMKDLQMIPIEKDQEIEKLKQCNADLTKNSSKMSVLQAKLQQMETERLTLIEKYKKMQNESKEYSSRKRKEICTLQKKCENFEKLEQELQNENKSLQSRVELASKLREDVERLAIVERKTHIENENLKSQLSELKEIKSNDEKVIYELKEKLKNELEENCHLVGHGNKKQRIHYVEKLRKELADCREKLLEKDKAARLSFEVNGTMKMTVNESEITSRKK